MHKMFRSKFSMITFILSFCFLFVGTSLVFASLPIKGYDEDIESIYSIDIFFDVDGDGEYTHDELYRGLDNYDGVFYPELLQHIKDEIWTQLDANGLSYYEYNGVAYYFDGFGGFDANGRWETWYDGNLDFVHPDGHIEIYDTYEAFYLEPQWDEEDLPEEFVVIFYDIDGSEYDRCYGATDSGMPVGSIPIIDYDGIEFYGWVDEDGKQYYDYAGNFVAEEDYFGPYDLYLYPDYEEIEYCIHFIDGTADYYFEEWTAYGYYGETIQYEDDLVPEENYKEGYTFTGWYEDVDDYGFGTGIKWFDAQGNIVGTEDYMRCFKDDYDLYAGWQHEDFVLTLVDGDEIYYDDIKYDYGVPGEVVVPDEKPYYEFTGWFDENGNQYYFADGTWNDVDRFDCTDSDLTLYAGWELITWIDDAVKPSGAGTSASPYVISSAENFAWVIKSASQSSQTFSGKYLVQSGDINLADKSMIVYKDGDAATLFQGNYNGNGYKISGLTILPDEANADVLYAGFFPVIGENGVVKNVVFENCTIDLSDANSIDYVGMIAGRNFGKIIDATLTNCTVKASNANYVGGAVGLSDTQLSMISVNNCTLVADNSTYVGGIVGLGSVVSSNITGGSVKATSTLENIIKRVNRYTGGIAGSGNVTSSYVSSFTLKVQTRNVTENQIIEGSVGTTLYCGGIAGFGNLVACDVLSGSLIECDIYVRVDDNTYPDLDISHRVRSHHDIGGMVGRGSASHCSFRDSILDIDYTAICEQYNNADQSGTYYGGVVGFATEKISYCTVKHSIMKNYSNDHGSFGGIVGTTYDGYDIENCIVSDIEIRNTGNNYPEYGALVGDSRNNKIVGCQVKNIYFKGPSSYNYTSDFYGIGRVSDVEISNCVILNLIKEERMDGSGICPLSGNKNIAINNCVYIKSESSFTSLFYEYSGYTGTVTLENFVYRDEDATQDLATVAKSALDSAGTVKCVIFENKYGEKLYYTGSGDWSLSTLKIEDGKVVPAYFCTTANAEAVSIDKLKKLGYVEYIPS